MGETLKSLGMRRQWLYGIMVIVVIALAILALVLIVSNLASVSATRTAASNLETEIIVPTDQDRGATTIRIAEFRYTRTPGKLLRVKTRLENINTQALSGFVWYAVVRPNETNHWDNALYRSDEIAFRNLAAGASQNIEFGGVDGEDVPLGEYTISLWVHVIDENGVRQHADGIGAFDIVRIAPDIEIELTNVVLERVNRASTFTRHQATFIVRNNTALPIDLNLSYTIAPPDDETPWITGAYIMPLTPINLDPGAIYTVTYRGSNNIPDGTYQVIGWLHQIVNGESQPYDRYLVPQNFPLQTVSASS